MATSVVIQDTVEIPLDLASLDAFRQWSQSAGFPDQGRIDFVRSRIEVDMSPEDLFSHGTLKTELVMVLNQRIKLGNLGYLFTDSTRVSSPKADLSAEPDIVFVSAASLDKGAVRLVPKSAHGHDRFVELEGGPDLVVEIVSDSSVNKDTNRLPPAYFLAGIGEFWLVDARAEELVFRVYCRGASAFEPAEADAEGFLRSSVLSCWFRLDRQRNERGHWAFDLRTREPA